MNYKYYSQPFGDRLRKERRRRKAQARTITFLAVAVLIVGFVVAGVKPAESYQNDQPNKIAGRASR